MASYWDTKIQEFFIENTYPSKKEILDFYDYIYKGNEKVILKTYKQLASESRIESDMRVWSIVKVSYNFV